jgi:hypothetical protein
VLTYEEYLRSPHWQGLRKRILHRANYACEKCGTWGEILHVHHKTRKRMGRERLSDLIALCIPCHNRAEKLARQTKRVRKVQTVKRTDLVEYRVSIGGTDDHFRDCLNLLRDLPLEKDCNSEQDRKARVWVLTGPKANLHFNQVIGKLRDYGAKMRGPFNV